jgi:hypothetical protein
MTTAAPWPPGLPEPDPIRHAWNCSRPPAQDHYRGTDPTTGKAILERRCPSCGAAEKPRST